MAAEAQQSAAYLPDLAKIAPEGWLGDPIEIADQADIEQIERVRRAALGGSIDEPLRHLGEAQTCHVILTNAEFQHAHWVTDDRDAQDYAHGRGITTKDTMELVAEGVSDGCCSRHEGFQLLHQMKAEGRFLRVPSRLAEL